MRPFSVILAQQDSQAAKRLADKLRPEFRSITTAESVNDIRVKVARLRPTLAIVDLELVSYAEVKELCSAFPATAFVGIHRLADEEMWSRALAMGAQDCCAANDVHGILLAADRCASPARVQAAAA